MKQIWNICLKDNTPLLPLYSPPFASALLKKCPLFPQCWCVSVGMGWNTSHSVWLPEEIFISASLIYIHAGTHTRAQTYIYMPNLVFLSELFHLSILSQSAPSKKRNFLIWEEILGRVWHQFYYLQQEGMGTELKYWEGVPSSWLYFSLSWMLSICPVLQSLTGSDHFALLSSTQWNLSFSISSLKIWQVALNQDQR